ncbi:MAG TPA: response regulator transcription factor [Vicinamibacteria bacterium]
MSIGPLRIILIEDLGLVREGLRLILQREPDIAVVGEAADGASGLELALHLAGRGELDVAVVADLEPPGLGGPALARRLKAAHPRLAVLLLSAPADEAQLPGLLEAGADGYLLAEAAAPELPAAVRAVARGEAALPPRLARALLAHLQRGRHRERLLDRLSDREREVLRLTAAGLTSGAVARRLGLSVKTAEHHRGRVLAKLGVPNIAAAIGVAYRGGLLDPAAAGTAAD